MSQTPHTKPDQHRHHHTDYAANNSMLASLVTKLRAAANSDKPSKPVMDVLREAVADPQTFAQQLPSFDEDNVVLFEDEQVSIWRVRFPADVHVPPHNHKMNAYIGVYTGTEINHFYRAENDQLPLVKTQYIAPGDVISIGPDGIHSVQVDGQLPSCAIHVYLGKLTTVERSLFDWDSGQAIPYTAENFSTLTRPSDS